MCPLNVFLAFCRKRSDAPNVMILLSSDCRIIHFLLGWSATAGIECIPGSAMYLRRTHHQQPATWRDWAPQLALRRTHFRTYLRSHRNLTTLTPKRKSEGDALHVDRDVPLPDTDRLVVRRGDHSPTLLHKGDGVDRAEVAVVLLHHVARVDVVTENLLVLSPGDK
eukprot:m.52378 g.52378  ORF g.52378 m.52378 type:complete len:166 (+) comp9098_c0_seq1:1626-2123(+)